jgi:hypothetical protein
MGDPIGCGYGSEAEIVVSTLFGVLETASKWVSLFIKWYNSHCLMVLADISVLLCDHRELIRVSASIDLQHESNLL